ncbi:hypothetical protein M406DRAFT_353622 [Cryphonectria parasitica EP155]|uniref:Integral membrane bound transporter domain-containing protein n=1 Tax=Cryphonectria parasitica (strain ATCC 38755 / EP155) TaxID=660469 RepID=A0A9P4XU49_CRYP1|nr:uncharacterized protein M406DRAFT_353622 [Cryphonectria parasitica EP155]KAF3760936.1 hypothetical protein M406DRAFT_353622 [Cryphonectria parasitica EP155]
MSTSSPSNSPSSPSGPWRRPPLRSKLRNGTFIDPQTGERSRRQFTLRHTETGDSENSNHAVPYFSRENFSGHVDALMHKSKVVAAHSWEWLLSPAGRGVLKCTLAYSLGSLFTLWAPLSDFLGKPDGKHVVATITVYFHPARTAGSMIEGTLIAIVAVIYAEIVSIASMATSVFFGSTLHMVALAYILVLLIFVGGAFGFLGWVKQRLNNPLVNVGSTLASLSMISVLTKENAVQDHIFSNLKIVQVLKMLVCGTIITIAVNLLLWRTSARTQLRESMTKASQSLGDMLGMISHGFLSGAEEEMLTSDFRKAEKAYDTAYGKMSKNLREAKFEHYFVGDEKIYQLDKAVYKSMENLAQSIRGLRSAANTQFVLLKEPATEPGSGTVSPAQLLSPSLHRTSSITFRLQPTLSAIDEDSDESEEDQAVRGRSPSSAPTFRSPSDIFDLFIALLGPSVKSLAFTLSEVLKEPPFGEAPNYDITINDTFRRSLLDAVSLFNQNRAKALEELYKTIELGRPRSEKIKADFEEVAAACGHFSFSLQSFGEEMSKYLDVLDDLKYASEHKKQSWQFLAIWKQIHLRQIQTPLLPFEVEREPMVRPIRKSQMPRGIPDQMVSRRDTFSWEAEPQASHTAKKISTEVLKFLRFLGRDDIRFGIKVGFGAILWAMLAFLPETKPIYMHWRGEWGLLSFMIVCSMTVGAANTTGTARFQGTLSGVFFTLINWNVSQGNGVALLFLGAIVAFISFYITIVQNKVSFGRTTLLAYNVSLLYAYLIANKVEDDDDDEGGTTPYIGEICLHRALAVTAGIIWGLVVCRLIWPISARKKFREGISVLYLQMGLIWKRGPLAILLRSDCSRSYLRSGEQAALHRYASRLEVFRQSAMSEFELRGPFPSEATGRIMHSTNRLLDAFYAMSLVTQRRGQLSDGEKALLLFTAKERAVLCERICHVFQVLASCLMLEYPLTDAIPSVMGTRDQLLGKIFQFRKEHAAALREKRDAEVAEQSESAVVAGPTNASSESVNGDHPPAGPVSTSITIAKRRGSGGSSTKRPAGHSTLSGSLAGQVQVEERDYALLYAYALVTGQVAEELKTVKKEVEALFGVLDEEALLLQ